MENVGDVVAYLRKRLHNPPSVGWRPLLERYIESEYGFHIHMSHYPVTVGTSDRLDPAYLCATFE
jgi:hypothetical protein